LAFLLAFAAAAAVNLFSSSIAANAINWDALTILFFTV
jgi:hypothetical protein